ncbi:hypothetical protein [Gemmobacter denitrificans]|uniref:Uncharacterized protein n=1 Tax=Gemmobacter denitrificans TaxID=3123040 RepID=A0ABU8BSG2_9RHOB
MSGPEFPQEGWLIHKAGRGWYRPDAHGYTSDPLQAGRFSYNDAMEYSHPNGPTGPRDGITIKHECEVQKYVRLDPAALAALPEVQAMIAEAVAKEREACAQVGYVTCAETRHVKLGDAVSKAILARTEWITVTVPQDIGDTLDDLLDFAWNCDASKRGEG